MVVGWSSLDSRSTAGPLTRLAAHIHVTRRFPSTHTISSPNGPDPRQASEKLQQSSARGLTLTNYAIDSTRNPSPRRGITVNLPDASLPIRIVQCYRHKEPLHEADPPRWNSPRYSEIESPADTNCCEGWTKKARGSQQQEDKPTRKQSSNNQDNGCQRNQEREYTGRRPSSWRQLISRTQPVFLRWTYSRLGLAPCSISLTPIDNVDSKAQPKITCSKRRLPAVKRFFSSCGCRITLL